MQIHASGARDVQLLLIRKRNILKRNDRQRNESRASSYSPTLATLPEASTPCLNLAPPPGPATRHRVKSRPWQHVTTGPWQLRGDSGGGKQIKEALKPRSMSKPILSAQIYKASTTVLPQPSLDWDWRKYQRQVRREYDELDLPPPSNLFATAWRKISSIFTRPLKRFQTFAAKRTIRRRRRHDCPYSP